MVNTRFGKTMRLKEGNFNVFRSLERGLVGARRYHWRFDRLSARMPGSLSLSKAGWKKRFDRLSAPREGHLGRQVRLGRRVYAQMTGPYGTMRVMPDRMISSSEGAVWATNI